MKKFLFFILILSFFISGCGKKQEAVTGFITDSKIAEKIPAFYRKEKWEKWKREKIQELPEEGSMGFDLRSYDLSEFDMSLEKYRIENVTFDSNTIWPDSLPENFDYNEIMEIGKNPGLGIKNIHQKGITGKGVNIAIIDQALLLSHEEYKDNIMSYELINCYDDIAQMHGAAVTSIAVGKNCGVAPDAKIYYIASTFADYSNENIGDDYSYENNLIPMAQSINRIVEINDLLPEEEKIKVISISRGFDDDDDDTTGVYEVLIAIEEAKNKGIFVITTSNEDTYGFSLMGLGRRFLNSPDDILSYTGGKFWESTANYEYLQDNKMLFVPMDSRTTASFTGESDYMFQASGGLSWAVPWLAGMYGLCLQEHPDLTPEVFIDKAFETGDTIEIPYFGKKYKFGTIINPEKLLEALDNM